MQYAERIMGPACRKKILSEIPDPVKVHKHDKN